MKNHAELERDIEYLGQILSRVISEQMGPHFMELVNRVFNLSKGLRDGHSQNHNNLDQLFQTLSPEQRLALARAGTLFLTLANFAENHHRLRRRRAYELDPNTGAQPGSPEAVIRALIEKGISKDRIFECVSKMRIDLVLTAHPTEVLVPTLQQKYLRIAKALAKRDQPNLIQAEIQEIDESVYYEITGIWLTPDVRESKPTPIEEARGGLAVIENVIWDAIPTFMRSLDQSLLAHTGQNLPLHNTPIRFDSWMGGDRDGNPAVTAESTKSAINISRWRAARLYVRELSQLSRELSFSTASKEIMDIVGDSHEPYRAILAPIIQKLRATENYYYELTQGSGQTSKDTSELLNSKTEFLNALLLCHRSLLETGAGIIAKRRLQDLIRRLNVFGLNLVRLDIRQEASRHTSLISAIARELGVQDYHKFSEQDRQKFLITQLEQRIQCPKLKILDADDEETLRTFQVLTEVPREALGSYIISMARSPSDVLAVHFLQALVGTKSHLPVVPLFEQVQDLRTAANTLDQLFSVGWYKDHISHPGFTPKQQVMIGYSDSAKAAGRLSAAWELFKAQEQITKVCAKHGVVPTLFHGRGGTVSRGGGPTYMAIAAQPPGLVQNSMRVTEQGETILEKFGIAGLAIRNMELYTSAVLEATVRPGAIPKNEWRAEMDRLGEVSERSFRELVESERFLNFFKTATPEPELSLLRIGSRPSRRSSTGGLKALRAIPWSFAWTQTRLHLPAWYGFDAAFQKAQSEGRLGLLKEMYSEWSFFKTTIDLLEMVLAKAELKIAQRYEEALVPAELRGLGQDLRHNCDRVREFVFKITGRDVLLKQNSTLQHLIRTRNPYVDPINYLQIDLLKQLRLRSSSDPQSSDLTILALLATINGIAAGMRNTG